VRTVLGGDDVFREAWATVPGHGARVTTEYSPAEGFDLWLAGAYRGAARHRELTAVEVESAGRYRARVDDAVSVDVGAQKQLWDGRLRVHFGVRNLLGAELRYHPAGADFGPTAILQAEAILP
jgi:outer membrane receptor for ferrienterochelin and colicin